MLGFIFPINCVGCGAEADQSYVCESCYAEICDKFSLQFSKDYCRDLDGLIYISELSPVLKKMIKSGKYKFSKKVWIQLGLELSKHLNLTEGILTFTPMNWVRFCYRGFNQSRILGRIVAGRFDLRIIKTVSKNFRVGHMATLGKQDRATMIKNSFRVCKSADLNPYKVCYVVDDIYTTGATLNEIAKAIKGQFPHIKVVGIVIAKTKLLYPASRY